jgi:uncharacterized protein (DUF362 family)
MTIVSVVACETCDPEAVRRALEAAMAPLGSIGRFVRPGMQVLLKPNLIAPFSLDHAVTTHPTVVRVVARWYRKPEARCGSAIRPPVRFRPPNLSGGGPG